jgi:hypothetical protein
MKTQNLQASEEDRTYRQHMIMMLRAMGHEDIPHRIMTDDQLRNAVEDCKIKFLRKLQVEAECNQS